MSDRRFMRRWSVQLPRWIDLNVGHVAVAAWCGVGVCGVVAVALEGGASRAFGAGAGWFMVSAFVAAVMYVES